MFNKIELRKIDNINAIVQDLETLLGLADDKRTKEELVEWINNVQVYIDEIQRKSLFTLQDLLNKKIYELKGS